jgi:peptidylprolyl isomerase
VVKNIVTIRYNGYLNRGDIFQREVLCTFEIGAREVIAGLEYGVMGMRVGGRRKIHVPSHLAYRDQEMPGIPPNAKLVFEVELLESS